MVLLFCQPHLDLRSGSIDVINMRTPRGGIYNQPKRWQRTFLREAASVSLEIHMLVTGQTTRKKTGELCRTEGRYAFGGYLDGTLFPRPTAEEMVIPMDRLDTFPPVRSTSKAAWWKLI